MALSFPRKESGVVKPELPWKENDTFNDKSKSQLHGSTEDTALPVTDDLGSLWEPDLMSTMLDNQNASVVNMHTYSSPQFKPVTSPNSIPEEFSFSGSTSFGANEVPNVAGSLLEGLAVSTALFDTAADKHNERRHVGQESGALGLRKSTPVTFSPAAARHSNNSTPHHQPSSSGQHVHRSSRHQHRRQGQSSVHLPEGDQSNEIPHNKSTKHAREASFLGGWLPEHGVRCAECTPEAIHSESTLWVRNYAEEGMLEKAEGSCRFFLSHSCRQWLIKGEGWVFTGLAAVLTGCSAAWIEMVIRFLSDVRIGFCHGVLALDRDFCCGRRSAVNMQRNSCTASEAPIVHMHGVMHPMWLSWSASLGIRHIFPAYLVDYGAYIGVGVILATLAAWLCRKFSRAAMGSGIPEVKTILGGSWIPGFLSPWTAIIKCVGLCLAVASGLSLGKEGPMVHVACCWAALVARLSPRYVANGAKRRELLSAASAAGVSVAFGAPLGGVLFSLEEVSSYFPPKTLWKSFFGAVIGALSLKWFDTGGTGRLTLFEMDSVSLLGTWQIPELIPFALLGLLGGAIGTLFIKLNLFWMQEKARYPFIANNPIYEVLLVATITCLINYPLAMLRVPSSILLEQMFNRCGLSSDPDMFHLCTSRSDSDYEYSDYALSWSILFELAFAACIRFLETCFTFGIGLPAGLFLPSLTVGALCGRFVGLLTIKLNGILGFVNCHKCLHPGVYAIVGAAAVMGGATRVTISLVVIMFELTGGLSYVVPFMIAVMIAKWVGDALGERSIYDRYIRLKGYPYLRHDESLRTTAKARDLMQTDVDSVLAQGHTIGTLQTILRKNAHVYYPVITSEDERFFEGFVLASELEWALQMASTTHIAAFTDDTPVILSHSQKNVQQLTRNSTGDGNTAPVTECKLNARRASIELTTVPLYDTSFTPSRSTALPADVSLDLSALLQCHTLQITPETPLSQIHTIFKQLDVQICFITQRGRLEGVLTKRRLLVYLDSLT